MLAARLVAAGATLAVIAAAPASAAQPWNEAVTIGAPGDRPVGLAFAAGGGGLLALARSDTSLRAATFTGPGAGPLRTLTRPGDALQFQNVGQGQQIAAFGRDRVAATFVVPGQGPWVAFGRVGGRLRERHHLAIPGWEFGSVVLAANAHGDVAVAGIGCSDCPRTRPQLYLLVRPRDGRLGRPTLVSSATIDQGDFGSGVAPAIAINDAGDVLVTWGGAGRPPPWSLYARIWRNGRWQGASQRIGELNDTGTLSPRIGDGRAVVGWWTQRSETGGAGSGPQAPATYHVAIAGRRGQFAPASRLDQGVAGSGPAPGLTQFLPLNPRLLTAIGPSGEVRVAWTGADASGSLVRAATSGAGSAQTLGSGSLEGLAVDRRGRSLVLFSDGGARVLASAAAQGQPFDAAAPETVDAGERVAGGYGDLAVDPRSGRVLAVWEVGGFVVDQWRVRYAVRSPSGNAGPRLPDRSPASAW